MLQKIINRFRNYRKEVLVHVYSHPRSGTHLLEAFLGLNFYSEKKLGGENVEWGHWANRKINESGNPYKELFGSHMLSDEFKGKNPVIYIYRDPRAVVYSIWKTDNFIHPKHNGIPFSDFLRLKLDWAGSPFHKSAETHNIIQHWNNHVEGWLNLASVKKNILVVKYEDLISSPEMIYDKINAKFFKFQKSGSHKVILPSKPLGLLPNNADNVSWEKGFSEEDLLYFNSQVNFSLFIP